MHHRPKPRIAVLACGLWLALGAGCDESDIDARSLAAALSEEFTDGIEFEHSTTEDGPPPAEAADAPQIMGLIAPTSIGPPDLGYSGLQPYEEWFTITLQGDRDLQAAGVVGAVAHIHQANKDDASERYIRIAPVPLDIAGNDLRLRVRVHYLPQLAGNAFHVRLAFLLDDGRRSAFFPWNLVTHPRPGDSPRVPMCNCPNAELRLHERRACTASDLIAELEETPCRLWFSLAGDVEHDEQRPYPSGTYFYPFWLPAADASGCMVEYWCL